MDLRQLRCFLAAAEELHFGRAAQRLNMQPAALGRHIRLLEADLGAPLLARTTRSVSLTAEGAALVEDARTLLARADGIATRFRKQSRKEAKTLRVGAIDSAAVGLIPLLLHDFRAERPEIVVQLVEDKTKHLLPRLLSGQLDLAFVRPPETSDKALEFVFLFYESIVVAVPQTNPLATRPSVSVRDIADQPLIVPDRRSRPHSHDATVKLFAEAGLRPRIAQIAEEKQTILNLVAADIGIAVVPRWASRMAVVGVRFIPFDFAKPGKMNRLPLAAAFLRNSRDQARDDLLRVLRRELPKYAAQA